MTGAEDWIGRVGQTWARLADATDRSFAPVTARLLDMALATGFAHALDIGCGAGELLKRLGEMRGGARLTGVDISEDLLAVARARCPSAEFVCADAARFEPAEAPDLLISRHGVMFFADPPGAFAHLRSVAAPGARLVFSCFRERAENRWALQLAEVVGGAPPDDGPSAPGPFAFGNRTRVEAILDAAGWRDIAFEAFDCAMTTGVGDGAVEEAAAYYQRIGPAARALAEMPDDARARALERLVRMLEEARVGDVVALPAAIWLVSARKPD